MRGYLVRRVLLFLPALVGVSLVTFVIVRAVPGDKRLVQGDSAASA